MSTIESTEEPETGRNPAWNRAAHRRFVGEVMALLRRSGFAGAGVHDVTGGVMLTAAREDDPLAETGFHVRVHAGRDHKPSQHLDEAHAVADQLGMPFPVYVQRRYNSDTGSAYAVMSLSTLVELLQRVEPWNSTKPSARFRAGLSMDGVRW